jgi:Transglutaminase-like superfamily
MRQRVVKFRRLSRADRRVLMRAAMALVTARVALKLMPLRAARRVIIRSQALARLPSPPPAERIVWAVETAGRAIPGARNCLVQALAAEAILLCAGHRCDLRIGVAKDGTRELAAHAWLENGEGEVLIGRFDLDRYRALAMPEGPG